MTTRARFHARRAPALLCNTETRPPLVAMALGAVAVTFVALPVVGLLVRTPWSKLLAELGSYEVRQALGLSLLCSLAATGLALVFGVPLAWTLARADFPGRRLVRSLAVLPMVLPPVVGGVALLMAFGRQGIVGQFLDSAFGLRLPFTTAGVIVAETFVAMPFLVITAEAGFRAVDTEIEAAGWALGARPWQLFRRVTLPLVAPSVAAGAVLCWARALGEFGATITFAGSFPGRTQTTPIKVYLLLETRPEAAIALSLILAIVSVVVLVSMRDRWLGLRTSSNRLS